MHCCLQQALVPAVCALSSQVVAACITVVCAEMNVSSGPFLTTLAPKRLLCSHLLSRFAGTSAATGPAAAGRRPARQVPGGDLCAAGGAGTRHVAHVRNPDWTLLLYSW
jgi:hypothetical protein